MKNFQSYLQWHWGYTTRRTIKKRCERQAELLTASGTDYIMYSVWIVPMSTEKRKRLERKTINMYPQSINQSKHPHRYMNDDEVREALRRFDDCAYCDLPNWLISEMQARNLSFPTRAPHDTEMLETVNDAFEHRVLNNELTITDYLNHYRNERSIKCLM